MKSDEFIKSSVENLVPNLRESKGEHECDVPACEDFTTFSNILFDANYDFSSSDDQSFYDEDVPKEIYLNPLFDEEIIYMKIDPHYFNVESDLIESLLNHDSLIISSSSKIDSLFDEFAGEFTLLKSIPLGINETYCDHEEEIRLIKRLLYANSSPRSLEEFISKNYDTAFEYFSPSHIPVEDSKSFMEEIDLSFTPDDPMPNDSLSLSENETFYFDIPSSSRPPAKPPDGNSRILNVNVMVIFLNTRLSIRESSRRIKNDSVKLEACAKQGLFENPKSSYVQRITSPSRIRISEGDDKFPVIIAKDLSIKEKTALITVLKSHKRAIAWKLFDMNGIDPKFCTHKILMGDDLKPAVQHQRRVNPKIHDVIKNEVLKLLDVGLIYPISNTPWVSLVHCVPKKGSFTVVENEENELIPTRLVTGWRVCIDYRKLNEATRKDHFPLTFMDQMLERLARNEYYCFLDGFSSYFQIPIDLNDQEKTTFTCPYETFAYRRMPFGLCNVPGTFQRCMMAIFHDMIEKTIEIARPMTRLLEKDTPFLFSKECVEAFQTLKRKLTEAPILIAPDWNLPFELMCDASDFAIGAILGQRQEKHFRPIHYAGKTMTEAEANYTITEKEMLAVVYAFE
nr:retrovirus-related Pol polyprotein from transposon 17.6 [Tanacetum cinerariifolium]